MSMGKGMPHMRINPFEIARASSNLLKVMRRDNMYDFGDLLKMRGDFLLVDNGLHPDYDGHVEFDLDYSIKGRSAIVIDYRLAPFGGLMQFRFDKGANEIKSIIRCNESLPGYSNRCFDIFGNFGQLKILPSARVEVVKEELERLARL